MIFYGMTLFRHEPVHNIWPISRRKQECLSTSESIKTKQNVHAHVKINFSINSIKKINTDYRLIITLCLRNSGYYIDVSSIHDINNVSYFNF